MTPEQWDRVRKLFDDALGRLPQERACFLESECPDAGIRAEVERLLANAGHTNESLSGPPIEGLRRAIVAALDASKLQGWRIDRYEILREVGRGGMGFVYLAVRAVGVYYLRLLFRWPFRGRWAGPLLVEATRPTPRLIFFFNTAVAAYSIFLAALAFRWGDLSLGYVPVAGVPFVAYRLWIWGKVEMRARGILGHGHRMRWHKIQSYAWEPAESLAYSHPLEGGATSVVKRGGAATESQGI
jgi:hypothetical protein